MILYAINQGKFRKDVQRHLQDRRVGGEQGSTFFLENKGFREL